MDVQAIETRLHKCQRRHARLGSTAARDRQPVRLIVLPALGGAPPAPPRLIRDRGGDDLALATWEDAEWC